MTSNFLLCGIYAFVRKVNNKCILYLTPPGGSVVKNLPANEGDARDEGSTPGPGRSPGGGNKHHSGILAWETPWTEEPDGLQFLRM